MLPGLSMRDWEPPELPEKPAPKKREISLPEGTGGQGTYYTGAGLYGNAFIQQLRSKDQEIRRDSLGLRSNSRRLQNNNPFMKRYLRALGSHVVGPRGMTFQSTFKSKGGGRRDPYASKIEASFAKWGKRGSCTVCGKFSWVQVQRMFIRTMALDGECFLRIVRGYPNRWKFALQFLDADLLDHTYNVTGGNGQNQVVMGVEMDSYGRPVAYWFTDPGAFSSIYWPRGPKIRIPANDIIHGMDPDRAIQTRGVPWIACSMYLISMLGYYWEAEVTAARNESSRVGVLHTPAPDPDEEPRVDAEGNEVQQPNPVVAAQSVPTLPGLELMGIPQGLDIELSKSEHPTTAFPDFSKAMLKGISTGGGVSYATISNDLTDVSFSSIRAGTLEDREYYMELQGLMIDVLAERVANEFIYMAVLAGELSMPSGTTLEAYSSHQWEPRGWDWVDPKSDMLANVGSVDACLDTRTRILAARGQNFDDVVDRLKYENDALKQAGIVPKAPPATPAQADATPEGEGGKAEEEKA